MANQLWFLVPISILIVTSTYFKNDVINAVRKTSGFDTEYVSQKEDAMKLNQDVVIENTYEADTYTLPNGTVCEAKPIKNIQQFYDYIEQPLYKCDNSLQVGGANFMSTSIIDGDKWVCLDDMYGIRSDKCIVLSFGIWDEWSFDDAMLKYGCKVYAFDPTMNQPDHIRNKKIYYFSLGLSRYKADIPNLGKVDSYTGILEKLGLVGVDIDYVKIDIERSEVAVWQSWFLDTPEVLQHIKQTHIEIHLYPSGDGDEAGYDVAFYYKSFMLMECFGFRLAGSKMNEVPANQYMRKGKVRGLVYELVWINTRFTKS